MNRSGQGYRYVNAAVNKGQLLATLASLPRSPPPTPSKKERPPREAGDADILEPAKAVKIITSTTTPQSPVREPVMISRPTPSNAAYNPMVTPTRSIAPITPYSVARTNNSPGAGSSGAFQPMSAAKRPRETLDEATVPFRGMKNLGNTCYVNAIVAAMRSVPELVDAVNSCDAPSGVVHALQEVFGCTASGAGPAVEPVALLDVLRQNDPLFLRTVQQDAHEALTSVLRMLLEQRCRGIDDALQGDLTNTVTCNDAICGVTTSITENFLVMSLAIPDTDTSMLHLMNSHEKVVESVDHTCGTCGNLRATSVRELTRYPPVLIMHLKRFRFTPGPQRKIITNVTVMTNLTLKGRTYHLKALVSHIGNDVSSGHYVCDFIKDNKLYTQDDSTVSGGVAPWTVMPTRIRNAYLAFYVEAGGGDSL